MLAYLTCVDIDNWQIFSYNIHRLAVVCGFLSQRQESEMKRYLVVLLLIVLVVPIRGFGAASPLETPDSIALLRVKAAIEEYRRKTAEAALAVFKAELQLERRSRVVVQRQLALAEMEVARLKTELNAPVRVKVTVQAVRDDQRTSATATKAPQVATAATPRVERPEEKRTSNKSVVQSTRKPAPSATPTQVRPAKKPPVVRQAHAKPSAANTPKPRVAKEQSTVVDGLRKNWPADVPFDLARVEFKNVRKDSKGNGLASDVFVNGKPLKNKEGDTIVARGARAEEVALAVWQAKQG